MTPKQQRFYSELTQTWEASDKNDDSFFPIAVAIAKKHRMTHVSVFKMDAEMQNPYNYIDGPKFLVRQLRNREWGGK